MSSSMAAAGDDGAEYEVDMWLWPTNACDVSRLCCWLLCSSEEHTFVSRVLDLVVHERARPTPGPSPSPEQRCRPSMEV